jgi:CheY-like chemotaxis protein
MMASIRNSIRAASGPLRVLVIDDCDIARTAMVELLAGAGYQVSQLPSPIGATQRLLQEQIDVVVLDVMMPSLRGDKLATLLRKNPRLQHLGVILVTGALPDEIKDVADQLMAHAVLDKAGLEGSLVEAVSRAARGLFEPRF